jgi:hypothetical protein
MSLAITIKQGLAEARLDKFDILGFDACLMAAFEAVAKFSKYCDYYLASEELEPGHGWDWNALSVLQSANVSPLTLASSIADGFLQHVRALSSFEGYPTPPSHTEFWCPNTDSPTLTPHPRRTASTADLRWRSVVRTGSFKMEQFLTPQHFLSSLVSHTIAVLC